MKVLFVTDTQDCWKHGIWFHRQNTPSFALMSRGHAVKQVAMGQVFPKELLEWPDAVVFGRTYATHFTPIRWMAEYRKLGKRVLYDMDDDFWQVAKHNPSALVSNAMKDQYEGMIKEADAIVTPSTVLEKKFRKLVKKPIFICPNGIDRDIYVERPHEHKELIIGYMGAASHWNDLKIIGPAISELSKKHQFLFTIYGLVGEPLEATFYTCNKTLRDNLQPERNDYLKSVVAFSETLKDIRMFHVPFMPPELHPSVLSRCDFDIGLAPLEDTEFNRGKSCIKYYEYAAVGTATIASDVKPYSDEVGYLAKNTTKDWVKKIEKLIVDEDYRKELTAKQQKWVFENRSLDNIGLAWEKACQLPGGLKVLNQ